MSDRRWMREGLSFAVGKMVEECGQLNAALGKTIRWGWDSYNPQLPDDERETNIVWVRRKMEEVKFAMDNLERELAIAGYKKEPDIQF